MSPVGWRNHYKQNVTETLYLEVAHGLAILSNYSELLLAFQTFVENNNIFIRE